MTPETEGKEEKGPSHVPFINAPEKDSNDTDDDINDPGNEDPGSLERDATVPLIEPGDEDS